MQGTTKVKKTNRGFRIWLEGTKLYNADFKPQDYYKAFYGNKNIILCSYGNKLKSEVMNGCSKVSGNERNGKPRPIIDLHNNKIGELFKADAKLTIKYEENFITISNESE